MHKLDPRYRIVAAALLCFIIALSGDFYVLVASLLLAVFLVALAGVGTQFMLRRILWLNLLMLSLFVLLPLSTPGNVIYSVFGLPFSREGLLLAMRITLRANAIMLLFTALVSTMSPVILGHALHRLRLHQGLVQMLFFTVRYVNIFMEEYRRRQRAMKLRGFTPRFNMHTLHSYGNLLGALLLSSFDRCDRIVSSMKLRGYRGRFYLLDNFSVEISDNTFLLLTFAVSIMLGVQEWLKII